MQDIIKSEQIDKIDLFPFLKIFFADTEEWATLSDSAKMQHQWMLFRFLSIKHPEYMQCLNMMKVTVSTIDALHWTFKSKGKQPGWMYTKTNSKLIDDPLKQYPKHIIQEFVEAHGLEEKSFRIAMELHEAEVLKELDSQLKIWNQSIKKTK
jgi:hypothetical protein